MATSVEVDCTRDQSSDNVQEHTCGPCGREGRVKDASHYCPDCDQCYCRTCLCDHNVLGRSAIHQWGRTSTPKAEENQERDDVCLCPRHPDYEATMYCEEHDDMYCNICQIEKHGTCNKMKLHVLEDVVNQAQSDIDIGEIKTNIERLRRELSWIINECKFRETNATLSLKRYIDQIRIIKKEINLIFDEHEKVANHHVKVLKNGFETNRRDCANVTKDLANIQQHLETPHHKMEQFIKVKRYRTLVRERVSAVSKLREASGKEIITLIPQDEVDSTLATIKEIGTLVMSSSRVQFSTENDEVDCAIVGMCQSVSDGFILADASNKKLIQIDGDNVITNTHTFDPTPIGVCSTGDNEVAVLLENETVQFMSTGSCMELTKSFNLDWQYEDITAQNENIVLARYTKCGYYKSVCTCVINLQCYNRSGAGQIVWNKSLDDKIRHYCGMQGTCSYMKLIGKSDTLYIASSNSNMLYTCDTEGNLLASLSLACRPTGVCVDDMGYVYAGSRVGVVYKVDQTGTKVVKTIPTGISSSQLLCYDKRYGRLVAVREKGSELYWI